MTEGATENKFEVVSQRHLDGKNIIDRCRAYPSIVQLMHITGVPQCIYVWYAPHNSFDTQVLRDTETVSERRFHACSWEDI